MVRKALALLALALFSSATFAAGPPAPLPASYYARHRAALLAKLPEGSIALLRQPAEAGELRDLYRPASDFWWATGFPEPDAVAVLAPGNEPFTLFVPAKDPVVELYSGVRAGAEGAKSAYGADAAFTVDELPKKLPELMRGKKALFLSDADDARFRDRVLEAWRRASRDAAEPRPVADIAPLTGELRIVKDAEEIALLRRAASLSAEAHRVALAQVRPGGFELEVKGAMVGACLMGGASRMAYPPIVGSGPNAVALHYERDDRRMEAGEMVVNDTACEVGMYAADVTRSYPVTGKFTAEQRAVYDVVLAAQKAGIAAMRPGAEVRESFEAALNVAIDGLLKLGILKGTREEVLKSKSWEKVYPHGTSHWIGLDVHDAGSYRGTFDPKDRLAYFFTTKVKLAPGAAITMEPGVYIPKGTKDVDPKWWGIGARIEDDVLITEAGNECLSCAMPREAEEIEKLMAAARH